MPYFGPMSVNHDRKVVTFSLSTDSSWLHLPIIILAQPIRCDIRAKREETKHISYKYCTISTMRHMLLLSDDTIYSRGNDVPYGSPC